MQALSQRFADGNLAPATIGWDPANDLASPTGKEKHPGYDWTSEAVKGSDAMWAIPPVMLEAVPGTQPDIYAYVDEQGWEDGMPPHVQDELNAAMDGEEEDPED